MPMTSDQLCQIGRLTPEERDKAAWHLAMFRAKKTYEELRSPNRTATNALDPAAADLGTDRAGRNHP